MDETLPTSPLPIEETPEITVPVEPPQALPQENFLPKKKSGSCLGTIGTIIIFLALFVVGVWLSSFSAAIYSVRHKLANTQHNSSRDADPHGIFGKFN